MSRRAFSLVEILVVISVVALLSALLVPVFTTARESAHRSTCIAHQHQIGAALEMYAGDWEGYPTWSEYWYLRSNRIGPSSSWGGETPDQYWDSKLVPYVKSGAEAHEARQVDRGGMWHCETSGEARQERTIGISQGLMYDTVPEDHVRWRYVTSTVVESPARTIFVGDSGRDGRIAYPQNFDGYKDKYVSHLGYYRRDAPWRHNGGAVYVYVDGHAAWQPGAKLFPTPAPLGSRDYQSRLGAAHCSMAANFAPYEAQKAYHRKIALDRWRIVCSAEQ